ncbi:MAG: arginine--tRNA ligase [Robiginitomaculum sp.]|nr:MAG: arginine--tRNA ligase [Robiginitomaculum sp.]
MSKHSQSVLQILNTHVEAAFSALDLPVEYGRVVVAGKPDIAPFQCNGALAAAKFAKKSPRDIAQAVVEKLENIADIAKADIGGPGFINLTPAQSLVHTRANGLAASETTGARHAEVTKKIIVDFGGPNVAKPMHVGHLRSSVIGDCLQRLLRFRGHDVVSDIHLGDWGLQMGHLITELKYEQPDLIYFNADITEGYPTTSPVDIDDLARLYPQASIKAKEDADRMVLSRTATSELQAGRAGYRALLNHFIEVSIIALKKDFGALGVNFDLWKGEAAVDPLIAPMVAKFKADGFAEESEGALIIRVAEDSDKKELPPLILISSAGAALYATTDLATIQDRRDTLNPDTILYVVDFGQSSHFEQVYRAAGKTGLFPKKDLEHIKFGTVNGTDGKRFRTRAGGVMRLSDLLSQAKDAATKRLDEAGLAADMDATERAEIARMVGLAAIKFSDLQNVRTTNYIFDLERFTSFEGKTGPYLLYAAVRIKSLLRKAEKMGVVVGEITPEADAEKKLVLTLDSFNRALANAEEKRMPHILCDHVYSLAQAFSKFYADCHILAPETPDTVKSSRLALAALTLRQLELGLDILGIEAPERM